MTERELHERLREACLAVRLHVQDQRRNYAEALRRANERGEAPPMEPRLPITGRRGDRAEA